MLSTKIRTTIVTLIAASSFAFVVGPLTPAASAEYVRYHYQYCNDLHHALEEDAEQWAKSGGTDTKAYEEAVLDVQLAEGAGCDWAPQGRSYVKAIRPTVTLVATRMA